MNDTLKKRIQLLLLLTSCALFVLIMRLAYLML